MENVTPHRESPLRPRFVLLCLALLLVVWPLMLQRPGLPLGLKADEPSYFLAARSLWEDRDLRCEVKDIRRLTEDFSLDTRNLILMTRDGWRTTYYAKPYFGSLLAAPFVALFGANGFFAFNMLCLLLAVAAGAAFLRPENGEAVSTFFAASYYLVSTAFAYVFWFQPESLSLASVALTLFFSLHSFGDGTGRGWLGRVVNDRTRWLWAGLAIGPAACAKPPFAAALLPGLVAALGTRRLRPLVLLGLGTVISGGAISAGQKALTGVWSPYFVDFRTDFTITNPNVMPTPQVTEKTVEEARRSAEAHAMASRSAGSRLFKGGWWWILHIPDINPLTFPNQVRNWFFGRHTGAFVYYPFLLVALLYFATGGGWRDARRWGALLGLALFAFFFIGWDGRNYHGGGGFVGNRYFVSIYPLGLVLVRRLRPLALTALGFLLAGLFLGQVLFAPLGAPVDEPTLQAVARGKLNRFLPFEFTLPRMVPGYRGFPQEGAFIRGRADQLKGHEEWMSVVGRGPAELFFMRRDKVADAAFLVRSYAPGNQVELRLGKTRAKLRFPDAPPPPGGHSQLAVFELGEPDEVYQEDRLRPCPDGRGVCPTPIEYIWFLEVDPSRAARPKWHGEEDPTLVAVRLIHLGPSARLAKDVYGVAWGEVRVPDEVEAGELFYANGELTNTSREAWTQDSAARVRVSYRWKTPDARQVVAEGLRSELPGALPPGQSARFPIQVQAPAEPGEYLLSFEPLYECVKWFGDVDPAFRKEVRVRVSTGSGLVGPPASLLQGLPGATRDILAPVEP